MQQHLQFRSLPTGIRARSFALLSGLLGFFLLASCAAPPPRRVLPDTSADTATTDPVEPDPGGEPSLPSGDLPVEPGPLPCTGALDAQLCALAGAECGTLSTVDACGNPRVAECGRCTDPSGVCEANTCTCSPEETPALCSRLQRGCGNIEVKDNCGEVRAANCGVCTCNAAVQSGEFSLPAHVSYLRWRFKSTAVDKMQAELRLHDDPGTTSGLYLAPFDGTIDGIRFYAGLQTEVLEPGVGGRRGKGIVFSRWESQDEADTRPPREGWKELGSHEGRFVGVRLLYDWGVGQFNLRLQRADQGGDGDWFHLYLEPSEGSPIFAGGLRFPRRVSTSQPASINPNLTSFLEIYSKTKEYNTVARWHFSLWLRAAEETPLSIRSEYPAFPTAEFPNVDTFWNPEDRRPHMLLGATARRCHAAGVLFSVE
ncbi:MAG: hypothetical protein A2284_17635 [Deltaproteobacteria bacterium RIFOXYA12_FULL_61_11]|nr:MAG: hypothetical protein A2284_17635 [Deltaproteobacteria bacterium RIFOXYA12_FULL_61_11]